MNKRITITQLMQLIAGKDIELDLFQDTLTISIDNDQSLSNFQEFIIVLDYILDNEETSFWENCECSAREQDELDYLNCKCKDNKHHPYANARKAHDLYFDNNR